MTYEIVKDGYFFRALNRKTGVASNLCTSASQAGLIIQRVAGKEAHRLAAEAFIAANRK